MEPSPEDRGYVAVRCARCGQRVGYAQPSPSAKVAVRNSIYCSDWCLSHAPTDMQEERNSIWRAAHALGMKPLQIAREAQIDHAGVYRVLKRSKSA